VNDDPTDPYRDWDAAYVLGMLSTEERRSYERHLATCPACTAALAELAGMPAILSRLSPEEAVALAEAPAAGSAQDDHLRDGVHGPDLVQSLARSVNRRRRRLRVGVAGLVVGVGAVLAAAGLVGGLFLQPAAELATPPTSAQTTPAGVTTAMTQVRPGWLDAELTVTPKGWGTRLDWSCSYSENWPQGGTPTTYDLVVTDTSGVETTAASWTATGSKAENLSASTSVPATDIRSVDIRMAGSDQPLVRTQF
jgi:hypothetical protein